MEYTQEIYASSTSESYDTFCAKVDKVLDTMPNGSVKFLRVYPPQYYTYGTDMCALYKSGDHYASVYTIGSYNFGRQGFRMVKRKLYSSDPAGQWDPLEYINPDMKLGVEYRTTERYLGKPVYCKLVNFGALPNNTTKNVSLNIDNPEYLVGIWGNSNKNINIPSNNFGGGMADGNIVAIWTNLLSVYISTNDDRSDHSAIVLVKYTKTTD